MTHTAEPRDATKFQPKSNVLHAEYSQHVDSLFLLFSISHYLQSIRFVPTWNHSHNASVQLRLT